MNSRQRVLRALRGEMVDRVPRGESKLDDEFVRDLLGFRQRRATIGWLERRAAVAALDLDLIAVDATTGIQGLAADVDRARLRAAGDWRESGLAVVVRLDGPLNRVVNSLGAEAAAARLTSHRTKPVGLADALTARLRAAVSRVASAGATAVLLADDSPDIAGPLVALELLRQFYVPQLAAFLHSARAFRLPVALHIAPWHWPILGDLVKLAPAALQGLAGHSLAEFRAQVGTDVCLWGNAGSAWLAQSHSVEEIETEVRQMLAAGQPRYIFGSTSGLRPGLNVQTVLGVYETVNQAVLRA